MEPGNVFSLASSREVTGRRSERASASDDFDLKVRRRERLIYRPSKRTQGGREEKQQGTKPQDKTADRQMEKGKNKAVRSGQRNHFSGSLQGRITFQGHLTLIDM